MTQLQIDAIEYMINNPNVHPGVCSSCFSVEWPFIRKVYEFAEYAHRSIDQVRKYTNVPYIVHPSRVAFLVSQVTNDTSMKAAAYLHDTVEDVPWVSLELIEVLFGDKVSKLVEELTDISTKEQGNRATRKAIDREHTAKASHRGKTIKLADLIDNTSSIVRYDPGFAVKYMREKKDLLTVLTDGNEVLWNIANKLVEDYYGKKSAKN